MSNIIRQLDYKDPGDETLRNFRYQFGYGVILLLAAVRKKQNYISLWCEHYEDFICRRDDGFFDCYQIKTSTPENGALDLYTESIQKSIKRFVSLNNSFGIDIKNMYIVSNTIFLNSTQKEKIARCPGLFLEEIRNRNSASEVSEPFYNTFNSLKTHCACDDISLFNALKKVDLIVGPTRQSFETDIALQHIPEVEGCENCTIPIAKNITSDLISKVSEASSLKIENPDIHLQSYFGRDENNPRLLSKCVYIEEAKSIIKKNITGYFSYLAGSGSIVVADGNRDLTRLAKKLEKGGLQDHIISIQRKTLATEKRLLELNITQPDKVSKLIDQLESVVQSECDDALLAARYTDGPTGERMLLDVQKRFRDIVDNDPSHVHNERYDVLIGFAGLLTSECKVWWSEKFDINQG